MTQFSQKIAHQPRLYNACIVNINGSATNAIPDIHLHLKEFSRKKSIKFEAATVTPKRTKQVTKAKRTYSVIIGPIMPIFWSILSILTILMKKNKMATRPEMARHTEK